MEEFEQIIQKIENTVLTLPKPTEHDPMDRDTIIKYLKTRKEQFSDPEVVSDYNYSGICIGAPYMLERAVGHWFEQLELEGWGDTMYWITPSYSHKESFKNTCKQRIQICEALINNLENQS